MTNEKRQALEQRGGDLYRLAVSENRKHTEAEAAELRQIERELDKFAYEQQWGTPPSDAQQRFTATAGETRSADRPLMLSREQRMTDYVRGSYAPENEGLSLGKFVRGYILGDWTGAEAEQRAMAVGSLGAGGALVPTPLSASVIDAIRNQSVVMRAGASLIPMPTTTLAYARLATDPTSAWVGESAEITASDGTLEKITFTARKLAALVKLSVELMEDAPSASAVIENAIAEVLALELDRVSLFGSGSGEEPKGIHTYDTSTIAEVSMGTNGAALDSYDKLSEGYFTVLGQNITPTAAVYAPRTAQTLDQLKTAVDLTPLPAPPSWQALQKFVTKQVPVNLVRGSASNASSVIVGDFAGLGIGSRTELVIEASRTAGDAFKMGQVWLRAYLRADVQLLRPKAFAVVRGIIP